ncbi:MAG TPA: hypothetical protein EYP56_18155 [Planctomycetaceae bacterium]|nr:hypothetical protein [Planctomycetaceae bacterium]HIQ22503.1 hypothetical protein [Planctomycetota bacterium]
MKLHMGPSQVIAWVYPVDRDRLEPGGHYLAQLKPRTPVVVGPGDHCILRSLTPVRTVGAG